MRSLEAIDELHSTAATGAWRRVDRSGFVIIDVIAICSFEVTSWRLERDPLNCSIQSNTGPRVVFIREYRFNALLS